MGLHLIYHFQSSQKHGEEWTPARYKVLHFFGDEGFIEDKDLKSFAEGDPHADAGNLTFLSLDDLKSFAIRLSDEMGAEGGVRMLSVQDYNIGLDGARDIQELRGIFVKYGETVVGANSGKKKGLFGKLFS